ncbi:MAG: hypothetical protein WC544_03655 [Patescibacteria group bacterium]
MAEILSHVRHDKEKMVNMWYGNMPGIKEVEYSFKQINILTDRRLVSDEV